MSSSASTGAAHGTFRGHVVEKAAELVHHDQASPARVHVRGHDRRERARRAAVGLASCWGAAILAVFLPVLHFVLVPALVLAGPLVALSQLRQRVTVLDVEGPCPACGTQVREELMRDSRLPMSLRCGQCRRALAVRLPERISES